jgi:hypothetical protein
MDENCSSSSADSVEHGAESMSLSPSTSAQNCSRGKRKASSFESENSSSLPTAKRLPSKILDSDRSDSPLSAILPHETCDWSDVLFPSLRISEEKRSEDAMVIFSNAYHDILKDELDMLKKFNEMFNLKPDKQLKAEQKCFEHAVTYGITIDCGHLDDVTISDLEHMEVKMNEVLVSASEIMENDVRNIWER